MRRSTVDQIGTGFGRIAPIFAVVTLSGLLLSCPGQVAAQTWNGSISDLWGTAANWTPNTIPNSSTASVIINNGTNNPVLINISPTIANLEIDSTFSASLNNGQSLTIAGGTSAGSLVIAGTLGLGSTGSDTDLILGGTSGSTITLSGGGTISLSGNANNRIYSTAGDTLAINSGNTIQGSGQIGINNGGLAFTLNNAGTIDANLTSASNGALSIAPSNAVSNTGTIEATNGGTLNLGGTFNNSGGIIQAVGNDGSGTNSTVNLAGTAASTINGGTLTTSGTGVMTSSGSTLNGVTISSGSTVTNVNGGSTFLEGTITLNGSTATLRRPRLAATPTSSSTAPSH